MIQVTFDGKKFLCRSDEKDRFWARRAKWRWNEKARIYWTPSHKVAARLRNFADIPAKSEIDRVMLRVTPWTGRIFYPQRKKPYDFQPSCASFALSRNRSYLALDPRLGKTIVAAMVINTHACNAIYICPPFLVPTTVDKLQDWMLFGLHVGRYSHPWEGSSPWPNVVVVPDTMIHRRTFKEFVRVFIAKSKYDNRPVRLFIDEAHRYKDMKSRRSRALFNRIAPQFDFVTHLSGTPIPNCPAELYPVLNNHAPETIDFMDMHKFGRYFCAGKKTPFGWNYVGSSNEEELGRRVKKDFMMRIKRHEVVKNLPPVINEMILIDDTLPPQIARLDKQLNDAFADEKDLVKDKITESPHLATYRKELGKLKVTPAFDFINSILDDTKEKLLVFAIHKEAIANLVGKLRKEGWPTLAITGDTPMKERTGVVELFQNSAMHRVLVGNIQAMGLGFDLWRADRAIFVEFSWTPGDNAQATDRLYKVGKQENVFAQYLVYKDSLDHNILRTNFRKQEGINRV